LATLSQPLVAVGLVHKQTRVLDQRKALGWAAVNELSAKLYRQRVAWHMLREDPAPNAIARLKHNDTQTRLT
jgi:hypothetical protein